MSTGQGLSSVEEMKPVSTSRIVAAGVSAGCYPKAHRWDKARTLTHAVQLDANGSPARVICGSVKVESILDDNTQYDLHAVDCPRCVAKLRKLKPALRKPATSEKGRVCAICGKPGGSGATAVLLGLGFDIPKGAIGYGHSTCMHKERQKMKRNESGLILPTSGKKHTYVFVDEDGGIADRERMTEVDAERRNSQAAPGQAMRWKPECETCLVVDDPKCTDPGHCEACGKLKFNTGPRERTCGRDECLKRVYGP